MTSKQIENEVKALRSGVGIWDVNDLAGVILHGPDAASYLHNFITADVKRLALGGGAMAVQPDRRGMAETLLTIHRTEADRYLLLCDASDAAPLLERVEKFHFAEDFKATNAAENLGVVAIQGARARNLLLQCGDGAIDALTKELTEFGSVAVKILGMDVRLIRRSLTGGLGYLALLAKGRVAAFRQELIKAAERLGAVEPSVEAIEVARIEGGVLRFGVDLPRHGLAQELGIQHPAFCYDKGCYVGQEVIARIRTKGELPHQIFGVTFDVGAEVSVGAELMDAEGKAAAIVTSTTISPMLGVPIAIARVKKGWQREGIALSLNGTKAELVEMPFVRESAEARSELYDRALTLFAQGKDTESIAMLESELAARPENLDGWEALGVIYDRQGQHHKAIEAMRKIVANDEQHLMANVNLSMFYMKIGDKETAEEFQAKATRISLAKRMAEARAAGHSAGGDADAQQIKKLEDRVEKFKAIIEMDPGDVLGYFGCGKALFDLKRFRESASMMSKVIEIQGDYSVAWASLGSAYAALGENDKARETFTQGIEVAKTKGDMMPMRDMQVRLGRLN